MSRNPLLTVAPRFHIAADWPRRVEIRSGGEWSAARDQDIGALMAPPVPADVDLPPDRAALIALPSHLRDAWWRAAEHVDAGPPAGEHYQSFVQALVEFFGFKRLPLPESCSFDVRVSKPGLDSTRVDGGETGDLIAWINLGDEDSRAVLGDLRLRLAPGQGLWLTAPGYPVDGDTGGKTEIDVVLTLRRR